MLPHSYFGSYPFDDWVLNSINLWGLNVITLRRFWDLVVHYTLDSAGKFPFCPLALEYCLNCQNHGIVFVLLSQVWWMHSHHGHRHFLMHDSHCAVQCGYIKNRECSHIKWWPCEMRDCIAKITNNFVGGQHLRIKYWVFGGLTIRFFGDGEKELSNVGKKWVMAKLKSTENMCHTHINIASDSKYQCIPCW